MLQSYCMSNIELCQETKSDEKSGKSAETSLEEDGSPSSPINKKYNRENKKNRKRDFVSEVFKDTGFICEV